MCRIVVIGAERGAHLLAARAPTAAGHPARAADGVAHNARRRAAMGDLLVRRRPPNPAGVRLIASVR